MASCTLRIFIGLAGYQASCDLRGSHVGTARHGDNAFEIVRILVVGIDTPAGIQAVQPSAYFSLFGVKEYAV